MEYVVARSRRTRHAHHQLVDGDPLTTTHLPPLQTTTTATGSTRQRRIDLEHEVAEMKRRLCNEQAAHDVLELALLPTATLAGRRSLVLNIPAFIPPKTKELLAEVLLVEEEIARLETQIQNMKANVGNGGTTTTTTTSSRKLATDQVQVVPPDRDREIKSMFFINQAMTMNGEYLKRHLDDDKVKSPHKETTPAVAMSPKLTLGLPPRNSLDQKPPPKESPQQKMKTIHPNKLSERIVKCLVCMFIRLLRSSRVAESTAAGGNLAARSGNLTSVQQHGHGGSFRIDTGLIVNAADQRGRGQQDHYGIFAIEDSIVRDIGPYKNLVRFTSSSLDLRAFSASPLLTKLRWEMLEALQKVDLSFLTHQQKLAFWLNIYNTCIMHGILQHGMPSNPEKLLALKNKATINVSGERLNALVIENFILRQPSSVKEELWKCEVDVEEQQVRGVYGLKSSEPNIVFALCCGTRSSPSLRIYKAERVTTDLEKAKLEYLQAALVVTSTAVTATARRVIMIPGLMHSNMHDFAKDKESLLRWICDQLPTSWSLRKSMVDCLRSSSAHLSVLDFIPYDYEFQYLLPSM